MNSAEPAGPTHRRRRVALPILLTAGLVAGLWWVIRPAPERLLQRALAASRKDPAEAERLCRGALSAAGGRYPDAQIALCSLLGRRGAWDDALVLFAEVDKRGCRADLLLEFGIQAHRAGRRSPALEALGEVRGRASPDSVQALEVLMSDYRDWEKHGALIEAARELVRLEPMSPGRWIELVDLLKAMRRDEEFRQTLRQGIANEGLPDDCRNELRHQLVDQLIVEGDSSAARQELEALRDREGRSIRVCADDIDICRLEGNLEQALAIVREVFPQIEHEPDAYLTRGGIHLEMGKFADAARDLERAAAGRPWNESIHFKLSEAYRGLERHEAARKQREIAADIGRKRSHIARLLKDVIDDPQNERICREIADLHSQLGEAAAAEHWKRRAAKAASWKAMQ
jgi:tetratricopeptide (TPR) repeat protein